MPQDALDLSIFREFRLLNKVLLRFCGCLIVFRPLFALSRSYVYIEHTKMDINYIIENNKKYLFSRLYVYGGGKLGQQYKSSCRT